MLDSILNLILSFFKNGDHFSFVSFITINLDEVGSISCVLINLDLNAAVLSRPIEEPILIDVYSLISFKRDVVIFSVLVNSSLIFTLLIDEKLKVSDLEVRSVLLSFVGDFGNRELVVWMVQKFNGISSSKRY